MYHVTQAKRNLKTLLLAQLPAMLVRADAEANDGYTTPPPYVIHTTDHQELEGFPLLELVAQSSQDIARESHARIYRHRIVVSVTVADDDQERLAVWTERYIWAIRTLVRDEILSPPDGTAPMDTGDEAYTMTEPRPAGIEMPFVRGAFIELFITTVE